MKPPQLIVRLKFPMDVCASITYHIHSAITAVKAEDINRKCKSNQVALVRHSSERGKLQNNWFLKVNLFLYLSLKQDEDRKTLTQWWYKILLRQT